MGSLGRYQNEKDVNQLIIRDRVLTGTENGVRIKTWADSPQTSSNANNMIFSNIVMKNVRNPIIIDQEYSPSLNDLKVPSSVKISDIVFKNIRGSSKSKIAVSINCSKGVPLSKYQATQHPSGYQWWGFRMVSVQECPNSVQRGTDPSASFLYGFTWIVAGG